MRSAMHRTEKATERRNGTVVPAPNCMLPVHRRAITGDEAYFGRLVVNRVKNRRAMYQDAVGAEQQRLKESFMIGQPFAEIFCLSNIIDECITWKHRRQRVDAFTARQIPSERMDRKSVLGADTIIQHYVGRLEVLWREEWLRRARRGSSQHSSTSSNQSSLYVTLARSGESAISRRCSGNVPITHQDVVMSDGF